MAALPLARQGLAMLEGLMRSGRPPHLDARFEERIGLLANVSSLETSWNIGSEQAETAGSKYFHAALRGLDFLTSVLCLLVVLRSMELTRERRNAGGRGKEEALPGQRQRVALRSVT